MGVWCKPLIYRVVWLLWKSSFYWHNSIKLSFANIILKGKIANHRVYNTFSWVCKGLCCLSKYGLFFMFCFDFWHLFSCLEFLVLVLLPSWLSLMVLHDLCSTFRQDTSKHTLEEVSWVGDCQITSCQWIRHGFLNLLRGWRMDKDVICKLKKRCFHYYYYSLAKFFTNGGRNWKRGS